MTRRWCAILAISIAGCSSNQVVNPLDGGGGGDGGDGGAIARRCAGDSDCPAATPSCEAASGVCVACLPWDDHCAAGSFCSASFQCVTACQLDDDCGRGDGGASVQCCGGACVDVTRDALNCGRCGASCAGSCTSGACALPDAGAPDAGPTCTVVTTCAHGGGLPIVPLSTQSDFVGAAGDLDGDGAADLVVIDNNNYFIGVILSRAGGFGPRFDYAVGNRPRTVAIGDLDGDGKPDLAVANYNGGTVSVLLNAGGGRFNPRNDYASGAHAAGVAIGDLDGDGKPDLAVTDDANAKVAILLNVGGGHFGPATTKLTTDLTPTGVVIADLNGDGKLDLATGNLGSGGAVSVLINQGGNTFLPAANYSVTGSIHANQIVAADLDGDGKLDLAIGSAQYATAFATFLNVGAGAFGPASTYGGNSNPATGIVAGDLDGDGKPDVAVTSANTLYLYKNLGAAGFGTAPSASYPTVGQASSLVLGDFNLDGKLDLAAHDDAHEVLVYRNTGGGKFSNLQSYANGTFSPGPIVLADFNVDGKLDVATLDPGGNGVAVLLNTGGGALGPPAAQPVRPGPMASADFDGDGAPDLVVLDGGFNLVYVMRNQGHGTFTPPGAGFATGNSPVALAVGDLDGDGKPDVAVANYGDSTVSILINEGGGALVPQAVLPIGQYPSGIAIGDLDGDGLRDVAVTSSGQSLVNLLFDPGAASVGLRSEPTTSSPQAIALADLDGDGKLDLVVGGYTSVSVHLNRGAAGFAPRQDWPIGRSATARAIQVGDVNGDCLPDVVLISNVVEVLFNRGKGVLDGIADFTALGANSGAIGDLDGDGRLDLVANTNQPASAVIVLPQLCF